MATERESINSNAAIAGHPLHPMMIHFPVAALIGLVPADLAYLWTLDEFWWRAALWLSGVGAIGGLIASIAVTAWCHAILAVMMLSLASLNWLLRYQGMDRGDGDAMWGLYLSLLTAVLISLAAFLGGRLVYEHAVGVDLDGEQAP